MIEPAQEARQTDARTLAASLEPGLIVACDGRLSNIGWFRADWQRSGAATGTGTFTTDDGQKRPVIIKLPVVQRELLWTRRLQDSREDAAGGSVASADGRAGAGREPVIARLFASGSEVGGYDLAWIVIERVAHGPLGAHWHADHIKRIAQAMARFYLAADAFPVDQPPRIEQWDDLLAKSRANIRENSVEDEHRWNAAVRDLQSRVDGLVSEWRARDFHHWVHGDMHMANAMSRHSLNAGPVCLLDLAEVRAGHWIEDAVYLERQLWGREQRLKSKPVRAIAQARKRLNLPVEEDYAHLAMVRRALLAGTAPAFIKSEGHPRYLAACLHWLERSLREL